MKRLILVAVALLAFLGAPAVARADDARGVGYMTLWMISCVAPNEIGTGVSSAGGSAPAVDLVWSGQIPLGILGRDDWVDVPVPPLSHHRIVYGIDVPLTGRDGAGFRLGWRYRGRHHLGFAPILGLGSSVQEIDGTWRPSISPEVGVHFGKERIVFPGFQLRAQADVFTNGARFLFTAGYTLF